MAVSRRTRFEVLRRDGHTCRWCGASAPDVALTVDHVVPVALGGSDDPNNLVTACQPCNAGKSSMAPDQAMVEDVDATAMMFAKALERAVEERRRHIEQTAIVARWFHGDVWQDMAPLPDDWRDSLERFWAAGVQPELISKFARQSAHRDDPWKYFCGCCWTEIGDIQEAARRLIEDGLV